MTSVLELYRCTKCGKISTCLGSIHAHIETHRGLLGIQLPWKFGDSDALMEMTKCYEIPERLLIEFEVKQ